MDLIHNWYRGSANLALNNGKKISLYLYIWDVSHIKDMKHISSATKTSMPANELVQMSHFCLHFPLGPPMMPDGKDYGQTADEHVDMFMLPLK